VPVSRAAGAAAALPSHLQEVQADLISRQYPAGQHPAADALPAEHSGTAYTDYIRNHAALEGRSGQPARPRSRHGRPRRMIP